MRNAFLDIFPSEKSHWMQKPIGIPVVNREFAAGDPDAFVAWYWKVFTNSFPDSRTFTVVRNPRDVFLSARSYWKFPPEAIWRTLSLTYRIIAHDRKNFRTVIRHGDLVARPAETLRAVAAAVELPFDVRMLQAFETLHVPSPGTMFGSQDDLAERRGGGFSHKDRWDNVPSGAAAEETVERYRNLLSLYGLPGDD